MEELNKLPNLGKVPNKFQGGKIGRPYIKRP